MKKNFRARSGFTLIEIMIVVAIIGLLAAIAIPNFVHARTMAQQNACINNLRQIDAAKAQFALDNKVSPTAVPTDVQIQPYMGRGQNGALPFCPNDVTSSFDASYSVNNLQVAPTCNISSTNHVRAGDLKRFAPVDFEWPGLSAAEVFHNCFGARMDMQFFVNRPHVTAHGVDADVHAAGDFLVRVTVGQLIQKFHLAWRQARHSGIRRSIIAGLGKIIHHATRKMRSHRRAAGMHVADGVQQTRGCCALEQVAARAGFEGIEKGIAVLVNCQHQELDRGQGGFQLTNAFHAIDAGHVDVHQDDVWRTARDFFQGGLGVGIITQQAEVWSAANQCRKTCPNAFVVIHDGNFYRHIKNVGVHAPVPDTRIVCLATA
jgi:prepilin-type N-terminal cleavage/methylation domain-containing protein